MTEQQWRDMPIDTVNISPIEGVSLTSNQRVLKPGEYEVEGAPARAVTPHPA